MNKIIFIIIGYAVIINILAALLAIIDKRRAIKNKWRISEAVLMLIGLLGGAVGEYLTMKAIHHKTKHAKFMIGLPLEIFLQIVIIILIIYKVAFNP
ncbi:MAG: DUF1294 domain-containing protein [Clostridium sp.]|nr:DUF1294 domain-containing protein [Clostridium sp.]